MYSTIQRITLGSYLFSYFFARCCITCGLHFCWTRSSDHVVHSTLQRVTSGLYLFCEVYSLRFIVLLDSIPRPFGVFHIVEGYSLIRWAFKKEAFSVYFIVDSFSSPNLLILNLSPLFGHTLVSKQLICSLELRFCQFCCWFFFLSEIPNNVRTTLITRPSTLKPSSLGGNKQPIIEEATTD